MQRTWRMVLVCSCGCLLAFAAVMLLRGARVAHAAAPVGAATQAQVVSSTPATPPNALTVVGQGEATGTADMALVSLGVTTNGASAQEAMSANSTAMSAVIAKVKAQGVADKDIQTSEISLVPVQGQSKSSDTQQPPQIVGFTASNSVIVTVRDLKKVGPVLDVAIAAGANSASGVSFGIADPTSLQQTALQNAVKAARGRADAMAAAAGVKVTGVLSISEVTTEQPQPRSLAAPAVAPQGTPVQPGELTVTTQVVASYSFQ